MGEKTILSSWPLRKKLLLFMLVIFLPAFGITVASGLKERRQEIAKAKNSAFLVTQGLAAQQEQIIATTKTLLTMLAQTRELQSLDGKSCRKLLTESHQHYPFFTVLLAVKANGDVFAASMPFEPGTNLAYRKHVRDAIQNRDLSVGEYIVGRLSNTVSINYGYPVLDANKHIIAVVIAGFDLGKFQRFVSKIDLPAGSSILITDWKGVRLFRSPKDSRTPIGKPVSAPLWNAISRNEEHGFFDEMAPDAMNRVYAYQRMRLTGNSPPYMYICACLPKDAILHAANMQMLRNLSILGIAALGMMLLTALLGDFLFLKPINRLVAATRQFGTGKFDTRTGLPHSSDELGQLVQSFDHMAALLEQAHAELELRIEKLTETNRQLESETERANQAAVAAKQASAAKSEFLANMSHEIRTPLNGVIGMAQILLESPHSAEQHESLEMVKFSADSLLRVINDILDFSKIEAGKLELEVANFNLVDCVKLTLRIQSQLAREKGLELLCDIAPGVPAVVRGDSGRLAQVITNLISNAIKFTHKGTVGLRVEAGDPGEPQLLHFTVTDTGIGVPPEKQEVIFEAFTQADTSTTRKYGGTGLGLTICSRLVAAMGGKIWLKSEVGRGTQFHFTARLEAAEHQDESDQTSLDQNLKVKTGGDCEKAKNRPQVLAKSPRSSHELSELNHALRRLSGGDDPKYPKSSTSSAALERGTPTRSLRVLLAEDDVVNQRLAHRLLEKRGHRVEVVDNGRLAIAALEKDRYDVVLMDLHMPEMDGMEATTAIRKMERTTGQHQILIALTANVAKGIHEQCLAAGMDHCLGKPIRPQELYDLLDHYDCDLS